MNIVALAITLSGLLLADALGAPPSAPAAPAAPAATPEKATIRFNAYDPDPPDDMTFQIVRGIHQASDFIKLGELITGTKLKLLKFERKTRNDPKYGEQDASELTVINIETGATFVLPLGGSH